MVCPLNRVVDSTVADGCEPEKLARHLKAERIKFTQVALNRIVPNTDRAIWICSTFWNAIPIVVLIVPCVYFENTAEWNNPL